MTLGESLGQRGPSTPPPFREASVNHVIPSAHAQWRRGAPSRHSRVAPEPRAANRRREDLSVTSGVTRAAVIGPRGLPSCPRGKRGNTTRLNGMRSPPGKRRGHVAGGPCTG